MHWPEFIGNSQSVEKIQNWCKLWSQGKPQKALLIYGASGVGKTAIAHLVANELNWQIFELNASDLRAKDVIERIGQAAALNSSFSNARRLILLDEIDATASVDRGATQAMLAIAKQTANPVILTAIDIYADTKLAPLRAGCELIDFKKINYLSISSYLKEICAREKIEFEEDAVKELAKQCGGDVRAALLDLQMMGSEKITLEKVKQLGFRERSDNIFNSMHSIFRGKTFAEVKEAVNKSEADYSFLMKWVEENIPREFAGEDISRAFDFFSKGDIFNGRIIRTQYYGFLKYSIDLMTASTVLSRSKDYHNWTAYAFPGILRKTGGLSAQALRKKLAKKIGQKVHCSSKLASQNELVLLKILLTNKELAPKLAFSLDLEAEEIAFLLETKPETKKVQTIVEQAQAFKEQAKPKSKLLRHALDSSTDESDKEPVTELKPEDLIKQTKLF